MKPSNIAAVVVHHRSYDTVALTVASLLREGVVAARLLVVDNSEQPGRAQELKASLPEDVQLIFSSNSGYGAAVNQGVAWHAENTDRTDFLLVSTHEAVPEPGCLGALEDALVRDAAAAVVGPALVTGEDSETVWSFGGFFSKTLGLPRHIAHGTARSQATPTGVQQVEWLDGAFLLYRRSVIETLKLDERFFLYMEETDHQQLIRRHGWQVVLEPSAVVWQSSSGTPAYYLTRNIQLFQSKNGSDFQRTVSAPYLVLRNMVSDIVRRQGTGQWGALIEGWKAGRAFPRHSRRRSSPRVVIVNPLGGALAHYTFALTETLRATGAQVEVHSIDEPSISGLGRRQWLISYLRLLWRVGRMASGTQDFEAVVTWPVLGFIDLMLVRMLCGRSAAVVYHDPKPLVRSFGSGRVTARVVAAFRNLPRVVVHSPAAVQAMRDVGLASFLELLAHPMLRPVKDSQAARRSSRRPTVRVLGQFKQDRDLDVLENLAAELALECELEIVGRGWPSVPGWKVDPRFVSEDEMDDLVRTSDAIVIPYKRFYQSGIAIRALELGTPIVGRAASSLSDLYGHDSRLLVAEPATHTDTDSGSWAAAVRHAIRHGNAEALVAADIYFHSAVSDWSGWISASASNRQGSKP